MRAAARQDLGEEVLLGGAATPVAGGPHPHPHARAGPNLVPSLFTGAALMVATDFAGQRLFPGHQLPVGVVTGLLGGAYLLLAAQRRTGPI